MSNEFGPKQFIHYNPERVDYSVTPDELERLKEAGRNNWRDYSLVLAPFGISTLLNALAIFSDQPTFTVTPALFFNTIFAVVCLILSACFGLKWYQSKDALGTLITIIKDKPKLPIVPSALSATARKLLPSGSISFTKQEAAPSASPSPEPPDED